MAISPGTFNDTLQRRADYGIQLQFLDSTEAPIDLTGWTVQMQVWNKARTTQYATAAVTYTSRVNGTVDLLLSDTDTATFPVEVYYDVLLTNPSGLKEYYLEGIFYMSEGYTA
jgi:hypothetical protein